MNKTRPRTITSRIGNRIRHPLKPELEVPLGDGAIVTFNGARILCLPSNKIEHRLLNGEPYDASNFSALTTVTREGMTCLDVGANVGVYTAVLSRIVGSSGQVHAFEPVAHIRHRLRTNVALNGARNVIVNDFALGEASGELEMLQVKEGLFRGGTSTFLRNNNVEEMGDSSFTKQNVKIETLDSYVATRGLASVDFIKIDVEGFETQVLRGAMQTLARFKPAILFEHDQERLEHLGIAERSLGAMFRDVGYICYEILHSERTIALRRFEFDRQLRGNNLLALNISD